MLAQDPSREIYYLEGGISGWQSAGFKTTGVTCKMWSIERQAQLVSGSLVFLGVILGLFVHHDFYILSGLVGLGLVFASITRCCFISKLLVKIPCNNKAATDSKM